MADIIARRRRRHRAVLVFGLGLVTACSSGPGSSGNDPPSNSVAAAATTSTASATTAPLPETTTTNTAPTMQPDLTTTTTTTTTTVAPAAFRAGSALGDQLANTGISPAQYVVGDFTFDALVAGPVDGEPVMLLHGFPSTSYQWRFQIVALADAGYRVVAPDQRGYSPGARPDAIADYDIDLLARDVVDIATAAGFDRFHLAGHDWGAAVTWTVGINHPDRLLSLTAVSVPHPAAYGTARLDPAGEQTAKAGYIDSFVQPGFEDVMVANDATFLTNIYAGSGLDSDEMQPYLDVLGTVEASAAALNWYRANSFDATPDAAPVATPTLFVFSTNDCCLGRDAADLTVDYVTGPYTYEILDGVSHWVTEEAPDALNLALLAHLDEFQSGRTTS